MRGDARKRLHPEPAVHALLAEQRDELARLEAVEAAVKKLRADWSDKVRYGPWHEADRARQVVNHLDAVLAAQPGGDAA